MKRTLNYGKHAIYGTRKINEITVDVCIEPSKYFDPKNKKEYISGEHFSASGDVWNQKHSDIIMGGQCLDEIIPKYAADETSRNLKSLWKVFHLQQMDEIPDRFRSILYGFVSGTDEKLIFEHKTCAAYLLKVNELITDYGIYTDGEIIIKTPDNITETIKLSQGDEIKNPITTRAWKVIKRLYTDIPNNEMASFHQEYIETLEEATNIADNLFNSGYYDVIIRKETIMLRDEHHEYSSSLSVKKYRINEKQEV